LFFARYNNVQIEIPCPSAEPPSVSSCDGDHHFDSRANVLIWTVDSINDETDTGSFEFSVPEMDGNRNRPALPLLCLLFGLVAPPVFGSLRIGHLQLFDFLLFVAYLCPENDFFPITCRFDSPDTYAGLTVCTPANTANTA